MTVIDFSKRKKEKAKKKYEPMTMTTIENWIEEDIQKLMKNTGLTHSEVIKMASDFYRTYPALIEHVRSEKFMAENK